MKSSSRGWAPRSILGLLLLIVSTGACSSKGVRKLRIGVECAYPPFMEVGPDGRPRGFEIDLANAIFHEANIDHEFLQSDFAGLIPGLATRKFDAIMASINVTEERARRVDFTVPYYRTPAGFVRRKGSGIELTREGLSGKPVGVQGATNLDDWLTRTWGSSALIRRYPTSDAVYLDMQSGRIDIMFADTAAAKLAFLRRTGGQDFESFGPRYCDRDVVGDGVAIALPKGSSELRARLNRAIEAIQRNGRYRAIQATYFDFDLSCEP